MTASYLAWFLWICLQVIVAGWVVIPPIFLLLDLFLWVFRVRSPSSKRKRVTRKNFDFAIVVTAHQNTDFVLPLVDSILKQSYQRCKIYVVADDCEKGSLLFLQTNVKVLYPSVPLNSKIKSIELALSFLDADHDALIILDADSLLEKSFLSVINLYFQKGYEVVQSRFKPKNSETDFARMDAIGDTFNFYIEREMRMKLGLSSAIWGSGIAIKLSLYRQVAYTHFLGGFDKKLQSYLVQNTPRIAYAREAILFDEKVNSGLSLENQRTRWISSYFRYFQDSLKIFMNGLSRLNFNLLYFGYVQLRPPLFLLLLTSVIIAIINLFASIGLFYAWATLLFSFAIAFTIIIAVKGNDVQSLVSILKLPVFVARQVKALFNIKKAGRSFLKTEHTNLVYIDDLNQAGSKSPK